MECNVTQFVNENCREGRGTDLCIHTLVSYELSFSPSKRFRTLNAVRSAESFVLRPVILLVFWPTVGHGPALRTQNRHGAFTYRTSVTRNHAAHPEMSAKWTLKDRKSETRCFLNLDFRLFFRAKNTMRTWNFVRFEDLTVFLMKI